MPERPSKSQVDKAGVAVRHWLEDLAEHVRATGSSDPPAMSAGADAAFSTIYEYQRSYSQALTIVEAAFSEIVRRCSPGSEEGIVGRPKRMVSIVWKLRKLSTRLSQIEDLWGFRSVLPDAERVQCVRQGLLERWPDAHVDDYVSRPRDSGYRAVHVVVTEDGVRIELQLRTPRQNEWADAVERTGDRLGYNVPGRNLKDGEGPADLVEYFRQAASRIALEENGERPDEPSNRAFEALREQVRPYFERSNNG